MDFTDWHRLFGITLIDYFSDTAYTVEIEKDLSLKKQFLDVVIIERKDGHIPDELPDGFENMAAHNLISYKSFRESFDDWSADELIGHFVNYRKQISPSLKQLLPKEDFRLYAVCTRFPEKLAKQVAPKSVAEGVYDLRWGARDIRLIVTSQISKEKRNAVWLMFSAVKDSVSYGVSNYTGKLNEMSTAIVSLLVRYETERRIDMPYTLENFRHDAVRDLLRKMTPDEIMEKIPDELFRKIPPKKRLKGLSTEEIFEAFSTEEIEAYLKKRQRKAKPKKKV